MSDSVSHPSHYTFGKIEVIEAVEDWKLSFHRGNAVKYIARAGKKNPEKEIEDLEKAIWYLKRDIALLLGNAPKPNDMNTQFLSPAERAERAQEAQRLTAEVNARLEKIHVR